MTLPPSGASQPAVRKGRIMCGGVGLKCEYSCPFWPVVAHASTMDHLPAIHWPTLAAWDFSFGEAFPCLLGTAGRTARGIVDFHIVGPSQVTLLDLLLRSFASVTVGLCRSIDHGLECRHGARIHTRQNAFARPLRWRGECKLGRKVWKSGEQVRQLRRVHSGQAFDLTAPLNNPLQLVTDRDKCESRVTHRYRPSCSIYASIRR